MDVYLMQYNKRENSTARPAISTLTPTAGTLRANCSVINPSISFVGFYNTAPNANYAYIPYFNRYYWVSNWTWDDGLWWADMRVDVLASWRTEIGDSYNYVLRSAQAQNGTIVDTFYPLTTHHTKTYVAVDGAWTYNSPSTGWYIIGIVSKAVNAVGATAYYAMSNAEFRAFMSALMSTTNYTAMDFLSGEISEAFYKSLYNPFQYVVSCMWIPLLPHMGDAVSQLDVGWWTIDTTAHPLLSTYCYHNSQIGLGNHPQRARGSFVNGAPYTRRTLVYEPFGAIEIDATMFAEYDTLEAFVLLDAVTGAGTLKIVAPNGDIDQLVTSQVGVPIQLAQVSQDILGSVTSAIGGAVSGFGSLYGGGGAGIASGIAGAISGIADGWRALSPHVSTAGSNGSFTPFTQTPFLNSQYWEIAADDNAEHGRPLCERLQLSTLNGYQLISNPQMQITGTQEENQMIKNYLSNGYFWE